MTPLTCRRVLALASVLALSVGVLPSTAATPVWRTVFYQPFTASATEKTFAKVYAGSWVGYDKSAKYSQRISASGGQMRVRLDGISGAAGAFGLRPGGAWPTLTYGRVTVRATTVGAGNNGLAIMLWPNSDDWTQGEADWEVVKFTDDWYVAHHATAPRCAPLSATAPGTYCPAVRLLHTKVGTRVSHKVQIEWTPSYVKWRLDGKLVATDKTDVPVGPHRLTLQVARNRGKDEAPIPGWLLIDNVRIEKFS